MEQARIAPAQLAELFLCGHGLYSWVYSSRPELLATNCPYADILDPLLLSLQQQARQLLTPDCPTALTDALGLTWIAEPEREDLRPPRLYLIGPVLHTDFVPDMIQTDLARLPLTPQQRQELPALLKNLPILTLQHFMDYGLMLHYALTGEKLDHSHLRHHNDFSVSGQEEGRLARRRALWLAEQSFLNMVSDGAPEYLCSPQLEYLCAAMAYGPPGTTPLRQRKNNAIVFCALCVRAAIRGGLPPETALALNDHYMQELEISHSLPELAGVMDIMLADLVQRVQDLKQCQGISLQIRQCCDYIQLHLGEKLTLSEMAAHVGYSGNYLTQKFRREMGQTLSEYILESRMARARSLLTGTLFSIQEISRQLGYAGPSYFSEQFRRCTGQTPSEYRNAHTGSL